MTKNPKKNSSSEKSPPMSEDEFRVAAISVVENFLYWGMDLYRVNTDDGRELELCLRLKGQGA